MFTEAPKLAKFVAAVFLLFSLALSATAQSSHEERLDKAYPRGDAYFLIGNLEKSTSYAEYAQFATIARWLSKNGFRPITNPAATITDLEEAVQNERTSLIIWSSHGNSSGIIKDTNQKVIPNDTFLKNAGPRLSHVVISSCHGDCIVKNYSLPKGGRWTYWNGITNSNALSNYLISDKFNEDLFANMKGNGRSIELPGGALPNGPIKEELKSCGQVFQ